MKHILFLALIAFSFTPHAVFAENVLPQMTCKPTDTKRPAICTPDATRIDTEVLRWLFYSIKEKTNEARVQNLETNWISERNEWAKTGADQAFPRQEDYNLIMALMRDYAEELEPQIASFLPLLSQPADYCARLKPECAILRRYPEKDLNALLPAIMLNWIEANVDGSCRSDCELGYRARDTLNLHALDKDRFLLIKGKYNGAAYASHDFSPYLVTSAAGRIGIIPLEAEQVVMENGQPKLISKMLQRRNLQYDPQNKRLTNEEASNSAGYCITRESWRLMGNKLKLWRLSRTSDCGIPMDKIQEEIEDILIFERKE